MLWSADRKACEMLGTLSSPDYERWSLSTKSNFPREPNVSRLAVGTMYPFLYPLIYDSPAGHEFTGAVESPSGTKIEKRSCGSRAFFSSGGNRLV